MMEIAANRLERAVAAICPDIEYRVSERAVELSESQLWWELTCCLLSSQVSYALAVGAADALADSQVLSDKSISCTALALEIEAVLRESVFVNGKRQVYRFSKSKAQQLASTWSAINATAESLTHLLGTFDDPALMRNWLVVNAPGIGPKQASMFLRNAGRSYDLAIIDRHVLNYMSVLGISGHRGSNVSSLARYKQFESSLRDHADEMGVAVGLLDWAIWIVMRAAREINSKEQYV
jgi:N-glycosylase/DNA lyase